MKEQVGGIYLGDLFIYLGRIRSGRGCIDKIFVFKQLVEKEREKKEGAVCWIHGPGEDV